MDRERRAGRGEMASVSRSGIGEARPEVRVSTRDCARPGRVSSRSSAAAAAAKAGTPGVTVYAPRPLQAAQLLAHGAQDRKVARMEPRHVLAVRGRLDTKLDDRVEIERRGIYDPRAFGQWSSNARGMSEPA